MARFLRLSGSISGEPTAVVVLSEPRRQPLAHVFDLLLGHVGEERQGQGRPGDPFGHRKVTGLEAESQPIQGLQVDGYEVGSGGDAVLLRALP